MTEDPTREATPANATLWMDRFKSASSAQEAVDSLEWFVDQVKTQSLDPSWILGVNDSQQRHDEHSSQFLESLLVILQTQRHDNGFPCEDSVPLALQFFLHLSKLTDAKKSLLQEPSKGRLLESLLDVVSEAERPDYVRVVALQVLYQISHSTTGNNRMDREAEAQWLQAPNGLHRLADLLMVSQPSEVVRNEALVLTTLMANNSAMAKVWIFAELESHLLDLCWKEGGLTRGTSTVLDALQLIQTLLRRTASDAALVDLVWQRETVAPRLMQLIDLRGGVEFRFPETMKLKAKKTGASSSSSKPSSEDDDDDLDSLLQSEAKGPLSSGRKQMDVSEDTGDNIQLPHLVPNEERVIQSVLEILSLLLGVSEKQRMAVWKRHPILCNMIWELALVTPPGNPSLPVCALPSPTLQQLALETVAECFADHETMDRLSGVDRLLFVVCTGGSAAHESEKLGLSQAALHVLRQCLGEDRIHEVLVHTLAPPPPAVDDVNDEASPQMGPSVIEKLWNTVAEHLEYKDGDSAYAASRLIFLSGSVGGLSIFLKDRSSREMMLRTAPSDANVDAILGTLWKEYEIGEDKDISSSFMSHAVELTLLRFLCEWVEETPILVQSLLTSHESTHLVAMASSTKNPHVASLARLLLGLAMISMEEENDQVDSGRYGGWTKDGILQIIQKMGISKYIASLEQFKQATETPWSLCSLELKAWNEWYKKVTWKVRKHVVEAMAGVSSGDGDTDDEHDELGNELGQPSSGSLKPLQKLITQQTIELEELRDRLDKAENTILTQKQQLDSWARRTESNPTELDEMLNEYTAKTSSLEEKIRSMEAHIERISNKSKQELAEKEAVILKQAAALQEETEKQKESQEDRDRIEQELGALSEAYSSLEEEYRKSQFDKPSQAVSMSQQVAASNTPAPLQPGDAILNELSALRAENARLKDDAKKADDWMSMAVQRMNDMAAHNRASEQKVAALQAKSEEPSTLSAHVEDLEKKLEGAHANERRLQADCDALRAKVGEGDKTWQDSERELQKALAAAREEATTERNRAEEAILHLKEFKDSSDALHKKKDEQIDSLKAEIGRLGFAGSGAEEPATKNEFISTLQAQMKAASQKYEHEIFERESKIRVLEDRIGGGLGPYTVNDIKTRDDEIEDLRSANQAAQDWMAKAVEHNNLLSRNVSAITEERNKLQTKLAEVEEALSQLSSEPKQSLDESRDLVCKHEEKLQELELAEQSARGEVEMLLQRLSEAEDKAQGYLLMQEEVNELRQQLQAHRSSQQSDGHGSNEEHRKQLAEVLFENEALRSSNSELEATIEKLKEQLDSYQDWTKKAQMRIGGILSEKEGLGKELEIAKRDVKKYQDECLDLKTHLEGREASLDYEISVRTRIEDENKELIARLEKLAGTGDELSVSTKQAYDQLAAEKEELKSQLDALELRVNSISKENSMDLDGADSGSHSTPQGSDETKIHALEQLIREKDNALHDLHERLARDAEALASWEARVVELDAVIDGLKEQLDDQERDANHAIEQWQQSFSESEDRRAAAEREVERIKQQVSTNEEVVSGEDLASFQAEGDAEATFDGDNVGKLLADKESELKEVAEALRASEATNENLHNRNLQLQATIDDLENQLAQQETDANAAISLWQDQTTELDEKCSTLEEELQLAIKQKVSLTRTISDLKREKDEIIPQGRSNTEDLQAVVDDLRESKAHLEAKLAAQEDEASSVVKSLENRCNDLESKLLAEREKYRETERELDEQTARLARTNDEFAEAYRNVETLRNELSETSERLAAVKESSAAELASLRAQLEDTENALQVEKVSFARALDTQKQSEARVAELEATVSNLQDQLKEQESDAEEAINRWQESHDELARTCEELRSTLSKMEKKEQDMGKKIEETEEELKALELRLTQVDAEKRALEDKVRDGEDALALARGDNDLDSVEKLKERIGVLAVRADELEEEREQFQSTIAQLETKCKDLECALSEAIMQTESEKDALNATRAHEQELSESVERLETQIQQQEEEANAAIAQWQESHVELERTCNKLEEQMSLARKERNELDKKLQIAEASISELEYQRDGLIRDSEAHSKMSEEHIKTLTDGHEKIKVEMQRRLESAQAEAKESSARAQDLADSMLEMEAKLAEEETKAEMVLAQWKEKSRLLQCELDAARHEMELNKSTVDDLRSTVANSESKTSDVSRLRNALKEKEEALASALADVESAEEAILQWQVRTTELESEVGLMQAKLESQEEEAQAAISAWEASYGELELRFKQLEYDSSREQRGSKNSKASEDIDIVHAREVLEKERDEWQERLVALEKENMKLNDEIREKEDVIRNATDKMESLASQSAKLQELENQVQELTAQNHLGEIELEALKKELESKAASTQLNDDSEASLKLIISSLEEELREQSALVQAYVTDSASGRATEKVARSLRSEISELRSALGESETRLMNESARRKATETETEELKAELAALLALTGDQYSSEEVKVRSAKAAEKLQSRERSEIEQLRKSLHHALDELDSARGSERTTTEELSRATLQVSVMEQEVTSAKSDLQFMAQTMEEMRQTEESRRASLEYRIKVLETDYDVQKTAYEGELDCIRNDLAHVVMEKERLLHALKKSEKEKAALEQFSKLDYSDFGGAAIDAAELSRLRIEKLHLVNNAAEERIAAERRLRESLAAQAAQGEADIMLERELRIQAETAVEALQSELSAMQQQFETGNSPRRDDTETTEEGEGHVAKLKAELQSQAAEHAALRQQLESELASAKADVEALTIQCRNAQARLHRIEREDRIENSLQTEVTRIRESETPSKQTTNRWLWLTNNPAEQRDEKNFGGADAYDFVRNLKQSVNEERQTYLELLAEHEDLLALLAQQEIEKTCLQDALVSSAGHGAVDKALQEAEAKSISEFGTLVQVAR